MAYPSDIKVYIDGNDVTEWIFGTETLTLSDVNNSFNNIDISSLVQDVGRHTIEVTCAQGVGRVEARVEID